MSGLEVLDPGYRLLWERAQELEADPRVARVALAGSVAAGTADRWSDLDLTVFVHDDRVPAYLDEWQVWLEQVTPTVYARLHGLSSTSFINALTDDGLRVDISVVPASRASAGGDLGGANVETSSPDPQVQARALTDAVEEVMRSLAGPFISYLKRGAHALHMQGVGHLMSLLIAVLLAENEVVEPPGKHLYDVLTDDQRAMLESLPPVAPTYDTIVAFGLEVAQEIVERARPLYASFELAWPTELAAVTSARISTDLGLDTRSWLY